MKFPLDFHNYKELNKPVNSSSYFTIAPPNILILGYKPLWSAKRKKNIMWEVIARKCSAKVPSWKFQKIYGEIPVLEFSFWRSSPPEVFCKNEVLKNFAKFKEKHLCQSLFFNTVAGMRSATLLKRDSGTGASCDLCKIFAPPMAASASNTVNYVQGVKLTTLFKRDLHTGVSETAVRRSSRI